MNYLMNYLKKRKAKKAFRKSCEMLMRVHEIKAAKGQKENERLIKEVIRLYNPYFYRKMTILPLING